MPALAARPDDDLDILFDAARRFLQRKYPGKLLKVIKLSLIDETEIVLPANYRCHGIDAMVSSSACAHSPDYRTVSWHGRHFVLTPKQAAVVKVLWDAWESGTPQVGQHYLLEACESPGGRLRDVFRDSPAWGTLVVSEGGGMYKLADRVVEE